VILSSKFCGKMTEIPEELQAIINALPIKRQMKVVLTKLIILEGCPRHLDAEVGLVHNQWYLRCRSIVSLLRTNIGRYVLYHELSHIIIFCNSPISYMYDSTKDYEIEERAWKMSEDFMGRPSRYVKHACLNSFSRKG